MIDEGLKQDVLKRQEAMLAHLGEDVMILQSGDASTQRRQAPAFFYMTGFPQKNSVAVFDPTQETECVTLFVRGKIRQEEVWHGFAIGVDKTREHFPADAVYDIKKLESVLAGRLKDRRVHAKFERDHPSTKTLEKLIESAGATLVTDKEESALRQIVAMRAIKTPWEIEQIRKAVEITGLGHHRCMQAVSRQTHEYQVEAEFAHACTMAGAREFAFSTIAAGGANATCQHYMDNDAPIGKDDMILLDSGCRWNMYSADLTRTFPASGKFTGIQRELYEVVLASEKAGVEAVGPTVRLHDLHVLAAQVLIDGLKQIGILHGSTEEIIEKNAYKDFWPGALCHSLGLDTHDPVPAAEYGGKDAKKTLEPGMIITVEPGFYSQDFNHQIPEKYKHLGIRIEDDVLVTADGYENLSRDVVKEVDDVEAMVSGGRGGTDSSRTPA